MTSLMLEETRSAPARVADMLAKDGDAYAALAAELRRREPAFVVTVARGSSDHAALYLASLVGILAGRVTASLPPSLVTRFQATLSFQGAFVVSLSQSGASPDIVRTLEAARAGGAITAAIVNQPDSPLAYVAETRAGLGGISGVDNGATLRKFVVDFKGGELEAMKPDAALEVKAEASAGKIVSTTLSKVAANNVWRLVLDVETDGQALIELKASVSANGTPITETWLYQFRGAAA